MKGSPCEMPGCKNESDTHFNGKPVCLSCVRFWKLPVYRSPISSPGGDKVHPRRLRPARPHGPGAQD